MYTRSRIQLHAYDNGRPEYDTPWVSSQTTMLYREAFIALADATPTADCQYV